VHRPEQLGELLVVADGTVNQQGGERSRFKPADHREGGQRRPLAWREAVKGLRSGHFILLWTILDG
jgi:hypothetical protein